MLGVVVDPRELEVAAEFFELFKTPWEPVVAGRSYRVVLSTVELPEAIHADVALLYGSSERRVDVETGGARSSLPGTLDVEFEGTRLPLYVGATIFPRGLAGGLVQSSGGPVTCRHQGPHGTTWRIGYDLFREAACLLREGQPRANAQIPTLELHIAVLRRLLVESGVPFLEVLPRPLGYDFTCCLTHDLDFFGIRRHGLDRTVAGFVTRASWGTVLDWLRGRRSLSEVIENWRAVSLLPLVHLGVVSDFWHPVADYERADNERPSTYFVVPFKGRPGVGPDGIVNSRRAVSYQASEVSDDLRQAAAQGSELALHGIDAWRDSQSGHAEKREVTALTGQRRVGIRMHWLYFNAGSPKHLESAGFDYDSTWGYNDAVGYRAGTAQVFRLPDAQKVMELPLVIMDTALLYRGRMHLGRSEALQRCFEIVMDLHRFGGTLVINWHDRSLAAERQWGRMYSTLVHEISTRHRVWFATAGDAVDWYRWRRSIRFDVETSCRVTLTGGARDSRLPGARVAVHRPSVGGARIVEEASYVGPDALTVTL